MLRRGSKNSGNEALRPTQGSTAMGLPLRTSFWEVDEDRTIREAAGRSMRREPVYFERSEVSRKA